MSKPTTLRLLSAELDAMIESKVRRAVADALRPDEYLTPIEAAKLARVHPDTVRRWVKAGKLTKLEVGARYRVSRIELERFLRSGASNDEMSPEEMAAKAFG